MPVPRTVVPDHSWYIIRRPAPRALFRARIDRRTLWPAAETRASCAARPLPLPLLRTDRAAGGVESGV
eukprot:10952542-Alexandrium_andersonii.AAC.1